MATLIGKVNFIFDSNSSDFIVDAFTNLLSSSFTSLSHRFPVRVIVFMLISVPILPLNFETKNA